LLSTAESKQSTSQARRRSAVPKTFANSREAGAGNPLRKGEGHSRWRRGAALVALLCLFMAWPALGQTLDRIQATKNLRIGFIADQAPFASSESGAAPAGYAIDVCGEVAAEVGRRIPGVKLDYVQTTIAEAFDAVAKGQIDLLCGAISVSLVRRESVDFSEPIFVTGVSALVRSDSPRDLRELSMGVKEISPPRSPELRPFSRGAVGVRDGTTAEVALRAAVLAGGYTIDVLDFPTHTAGLAALEARQIDAYFADRALLAALLTKAGDPSGLIVGTRLFTRELYAIAMKRGDADFRLLVDRALTRFYTSRDFPALLASYFGPDSSELRASILAQSVPE
jgi:polar amino acid transport system substrate-binding protein